MRALTRLTTLMGLLVLLAAVAWDPAAGAPSLVVSQPGRPPVVIGITKTADKRCRYCWLLVWLLLLLLVALGLLVLWLLR